MENNRALAGRGGRVLVVVMWMAAALMVCATAATAQAATLKAAGTVTPEAQAPAVAGGVYDSALKFDASNYSTITVSIDGVATSVRWYASVCYVGNPQVMAATQANGMGGGTTTIADPRCGYESMNIFVPERVANSQAAAIYLGFNNGGWKASYLTASVKDGASLDSSSSNVGAALKAGYVYIDVATRGRGLTAADGSYAGQSPAVVVDAKAAVRYLRLNDARMPGNAERIVVNGTSGGGGLVTALGASGNSRDYLSFLAAVGAAGVDARGRSTLRDDVFAVNAYCPISDLGNADLAYEWLYTALGTRATVASNPSPQVSATLAARYPAYLSSLHLKAADGSALTSRNMMASIQREVIRSAEAYLAAASTNSIPALGEAFSYTSGTSTVSYTNDWIEVNAATRKVVSVNMERYLAYVASLTTLKAAPAFDQQGLSWETSTGETNLFGTSAQAYSNFTDFSWNANDTTGDGVGYDDTGWVWSAFTKTSAGEAVARQVKLINPLAYIGTTADTAPYWYVRHGTRDRDTAFTVSVNLSRALAEDSHVHNLNYRLAWNQPHAGNYDVPEAMAWIAKVLNAGATDASPWR